MRHYVAHLAVLALADRHGQPMVLALIALDLDPDRSVSNAIDRNAAGHRGQPPSVEASVHLHPVPPRPGVLRQFEMAGQFAVVGEQQQTFGIEVQAPHAHDARHIFGQMLEHRRPALRVPGGRNGAGSLVVAPYARLVGRGDRPPVDGDGVPSRDVDGRRGQHRAVHGHAAFGDHPFRIAAGAHPGPGQHLGYALPLEGRGLLRAIFFRTVLRRIMLH